MDEAELNAIRQARLRELQLNAEGLTLALSQNAGAGAGDASAVLAQLLEPSARERLSRVRMVRPERAQQVEQYIVRLAQMGQLQRKLTEKDVVDIFDGVARDSQQKLGGQIVYSRKPANDDDDDDDFFD